MKTYYKQWLEVEADLVASPYRMVLESIQNITDEMEKSQRAKAEARARMKDLDSKITYLASQKR